MKTDETRVVVPATRSVERSETRSMEATNRLKLRERQEKTKEQARRDHHLGVVASATSLTHRRERNANTQA
eukprot:4933348-Pleurochrysis_carterae.AAC.1